MALPIADTVLYEGAYTLRPYFLAQFAEIKSWENLPDNHKYPRDFVIYRFLNREAGLLQEMVSINSDNAYKALKNFFGEVSFDMAERETDVIDVEFLAFICDVVFEDVLSKQDIKKLQHKIGSLALLERTESSDRLCRFPHSEVRFYFLARKLIDEVSEDNIPLVLRRGVLGTDFLEVFTDIFNNSSKKAADKFVSQLYQILKREISADRLRHNGTSLLLSALSHDSSKNSFELEGLEANEATFYKMSPAAKLTNISVARLDARSADLSRVIFHNCDAAILIADELTKFGETHPDVNVIHSVQNQLASIITNSSCIADWITKHSNVS